MKNVFIALFAVGLFTSCTSNSLTKYDNQIEDKAKIERPGSQGIDMAAVDKDKIRRPGSQG